AQGLALQSAQAAREIIATQVEQLCQMLQARRWIYAIKTARTVALAGTVLSSPALSEASQAALEASGLMALLSKRQFEMANKVAGALSRQVNVLVRPIQVRLGQSRDLAASIQVALTSRDFQKVRALATAIARLAGLMGDPAIRVCLLLATELPGIEAGLKREEYDVALQTLSDILRSAPMR
ncbi:MAG: hypothetical protein KGR26_12075, partial [Cyanobacteria bacterium REEB65]|nr:hypothetical protein [Cyanobacteria bacterium REEB65]